jgi:Rieske Fe-S protein
MNMPPMDRRTFCGAMCGAAGFGLLALQGCGHLRYLNVQASGGRLRVPTTAFGDAPAVLIDADELNGRPLYVRQVAARQYLALSTRCTHRGCQVEPSGERLVCPCHGSEYSLTGQVLHGPAERSLASYPVTVEGNDLVIQLSGSEP